MHPLTSPVAHNSGVYNMRAGDHVIYAIDGRTGIVDEFLSDGEALMTWDDGTYGIVNWYHLAPARHKK